jgi:AcrR family transcriptional regulator
MADGDASGRPTPALRSDARRNRDRMIGAARDVFAEYGLGASLEEIARRAGVRVGTLYHRFGGRTGLIDAALTDRVEASIRLAEAALSEPDPWRGLVDHLTEIARWQAEDRGFTEVCVHAFPDDLAIERAKARGHQLTQQLVDRAHAAGVLRRDIGLADIGLLVWGVVRATEGIKDVEPEAWRRHLGVVLDGLRAETAHRLPGTPLDPDQVRAAMAYPSPAGR